MFQCDENHFFAKILSQKYNDFILFVIVTEKEIGVNGKRYSDLYGNGNLKIIGNETGNYLTRV